MPQKPKILVAYCGLCNHVQTTFEYLKSFGNNDRVFVDYAHVTRQYDVRNPVGFETDISFYYAVILHYSARLSIKGYVSEEFQKKLRDYRGVKVVIAQDEYENTDILKERLSALGIDLLVTCVPPEGIDYVYGDLKSKNLSFFHALTGYVSEDFKMKSTASPPIAERPIHIGYRGRDLGGRYGALARDKYEIAVHFQTACQARQIPCDIRTDEASRIYGTDWYRFLRNCRAALGTQSGSNVFDFDGSLASLYADLQRRTGGIGLGYADFSIYTESRESAVDMGQISPRIFEYAHCRTAMILLEGSYSGAIQPDIHYISIRKDYSNIEEVLDKLADVDVLEKMTERAFQDLIVSDQYTYKRFVDHLLDAIDEIQRGRVLPEFSTQSRQPRTGRLDRWWDIDLWNIKPDTSILGPQNLLARQRIANFRQELWRMAALEQQIIDGYRIQSAEDVFQCQGHPSVDAVTENISLLIEMQRERHDACDTLFRNGQIDENQVDRVSFLFERQVDHMYAIYHQLLEALVDVCPPGQLQLWRDP